MMNEIDTLKDQAWAANAAGKWEKLGVILGTLERIWTDDPAARVFYTQLQKSAISHGAPSSITNPIDEKVTAMNDTAQVDRSEGNSPAGWRKPEIIPAPEPEPVAATKKSAAKTKKAAPAVKPAAAKVKAPGLTDKQRDAIRAERAAGKPYGEIAKAYGIFQDEVRRICKPAKPAAATKSAAEPKPPVAGNPAKFANAFTRTFAQLLGPFGYKQVTTGSEPGLIVFAADDTRVEVTNPGKAGGSASAAYSVTRKNGKPTTGAGRDALADLLGVPRLVRK